MTTSPMNELSQSMRQNGLIRFLSHFAEMFPDGHLKDLVVDECGPNREMVVSGHQVINFGSDSFLGLDQDPRVIDAVRHGVDRWGTHNGASRAFSSVRANIDAEEKLADWLDIESVLIFPSVTLANMGALPGLLGRQDLLVIDEFAHNSMQEAAKIARSNGTQVLTFAHCDPQQLRQTFAEATKYRCAVVAIDGVYSMSGALPPLRELDAVARENRAVMYVDDAHGTGVLGTHGRGTVLDALGTYENTIVVGSLSKAFSCMGGFVGCSAELKRLLKFRSNTYIFGGPVPPPYLDAVCKVCDILASGEYRLLHGRMQAHLTRLTQGLKDLGLVVLGGETPIVSVLVGDEEHTIKAGRFLFDQGYYVQSVTFPAVPYHAGVLRIQVNSNHLRESVGGLLDAFAALHKAMPLPGPEVVASAHAA